MFWFLKPYVFYWNLSLSDYFLTLETLYRLDNAHLTLAIEFWIFFILFFFFPLEEISSWFCLLYIQVLLNAITLWIAYFRTTVLGPSLLFSSFHIQLPNRMSFISPCLSSFFSVVIKPCLVSLSFLYLPLMCYLPGLCPKGQKYTWHGSSKITSIGSRVLLLEYLFDPLFYVQKILLVQNVYLIFHIYFIIYKMWFLKHVSGL